MSYFLSFILGLIFSLGQPPYNFALASIFALALFIYLLNNFSVRKILLSYFFGYGYCIYSVHWFAESLYAYGNSLLWLVPISLIFLPAAMALYFALFGYLVEKFAKKNILVIAAIWLAIEVIRSNLVLEFSWLLVGYIWSDSLMAQSVSLFGIWGLSFLTVFWAGSIAIMLESILYHFRNSTSSGDFQVNNRNIFLAFISYCLCIIYSFSHLNQQTIPQNITVKVIQPNFNQNLSARLKDGYSNLTNLIALSKDEQQVNYVIWPEGVIDFKVDDNLLFLLKQAVPAEGELIFSATRIDFNQKKAWNSIFSLNKKAEIIDYYDKIHLVPFGEYIPFKLRKIFPFINKITPGDMDFSQGEKDPVMKSKFPYLAKVCYEATFTDSSNNYFTWIANLTNDGWFGKSFGPKQHLEMIKFRSIELGVPMVRSALTGVSAIIDSFGNIKESIPLQTSAIIKANIPGYLASKTYFYRYNYWCCFSLLFIFLVMSRRENLQKS